MAKHVLYDAKVTFNAVDLSDHVESVSYTDGIAPQPAAGMSQVQSFDMPGVIIVSPISITFYQDFAATQVYITIHAAVLARTVASLIVKPTSAVDSATNPAFTMDVFVASCGLVNGTRGDRHMTQVVFQPAGAMTVDVT